MTRILVLSFLEEAKAYTALRKLDELEQQGEITTYEKTMVCKKEDNDYEILKEENKQDGKTMTGMAIGGLLGMLGGPIGLLAGLYAGTTLGAYSDASHYDKAEAFLRKVENQMPAGTFSIVAEVDENNSYILDTTFAPMDAVITWSDSNPEYIKYFGEQIAELNHEIAACGRALKTADDAQRKELEKKLLVMHQLRRDKIAAIHIENGKNSFDNHTG